MPEFFLDGNNLVFTIVLGLLVALFFIELAGLLLGSGLGGLLGDLDLPDGPSLDLDADLDPGLAVKFLYWLKIGRVPLIILIVIFMAVFVTAGFLLQFLALKILGALMPWWLAVPAALVLSVPLLRLVGGPLARLIPKDETAAVSQGELVGGRAVIVLGLAKKDSPAQARTTDRHGTSHYLMVEPDEPGETLEPGSDLLLVRHAGNRFFAIRHPNSADPEADD